MSLKEIAMPQKTRLPNEHMKRQDEIRNETSEVKQSRLKNIGERTADESKTEQQGRLERNRLSKLKIKLLKKSEENERKRQYMREFYQRVKATEEQRESRLERQRVRNRRIRQTETEEQREKRLESQRARMRRTETPELRKKRLEKQHVCKSLLRKAEIPEQRKGRLESDRTRRSKSRAAETQEQRMERLEKYRKLNTRRKNVVKNKEDVMPVEPTVVIKEEPIQSNPEPLSSEDKVIKNVERDNGEAVLVEPLVVIKEQPISFDPQPSASADIVIKEEFIVCSEDDTGSSVYESPSTEPTSHVTLSVACLGSGRKSNSDQ
ncbi:hypothetical protein CDAR_16351 [Caerostris darwini]|uniref:Uncharacterized protein n=1 Tax=Caerostris darwini TaxID=1538125 RepID=A0AAV4WR29_9ARAC|nr:hypothetical protein CDAR_16351 [Caerostris darwini]